ncbi:MAG: hypothetical protein ACK56I_37415, partial [bacterium]
RRQRDVHAPAHVVPEAGQPQQQQLEVGPQLVAKPQGRRHRENLGVGVRREDEHEPERDQHHQRAGTDRGMGQGGSGLHVEPLRSPSRRLLPQVASAITANSSQAMAEAV